MNLNWAEREQHSWSCRGTKSSFEQRALPFDTVNHNSTEKKLRICRNFYKGPNVAIQCRVLKTMWHFSVPAKRKTYMACTCLMHFQETGEGRHQCHWTPDQFDQFQRRLLVPHNRQLLHSVVLSYSLGHRYCHFDFQGNSAAAAVVMAAFSAVPSLLVSESCLLETAPKVASTKIRLLNNIERWTVMQAHKAGQDKGRK